MKKSYFLLCVCVLTLIPAAYMRAQLTCTSNNLEQYIRNPGLQNQTGRSFLLPRAVFDNLAAKQALWHNIIYDKQGSNNSAWQVIPLYQQSIQADKTKRYFLFNDKNSLTVKGDSYECDRDIRAEWLNITDADFNGTLSVNPQQRQMGFLAEFHKDLRGLFDWNFFDEWWVGMSIPFVLVENDMNLCQTFAHPSADGTDICSAFNQCDWQYAKINGKQRETGFAQIEFVLGTNMLNRNYSQIGIYSTLIVPMQHKQCPEYLFAPILGNNKHWGFGTGIQFQLCLNENYAEKNCAFFLNIENQFLWRNTQHRTFDLKDKPWSRYLLLNCSDGRKNIPAMNVLTLKVQASPFNMVDLSLGFRYRGKHFEGEFGYDLWAHGSEELLLRHDWKEIYGIAGQGNATTDCPLICGTEIGATASKSTISEQCANDLDTDNNPTFVPIHLVDIDLTSGARASAITHKFHTSVGYTWNNGAFVGAIAFFEGAQKNTALKQWGISAKIGTTI